MVSWQKRDDSYFAVSLIVGAEACGMSTNIRQAAIGDEALLASLNRFVQEFHIARRPDDFKRTQPEELAR